MKKIDLQEMAGRNDGEYVFGTADTGSHACYMIYGTMKPGEEGRVLKPGKGHEEIVLSVNALLKVTGDFTGTLEPGKAFHLAGETTCYIENAGDTEAVYVIAGGHSGEGHGH